MDEKTGGIALYLAKTKQFTRNSKLVLFYSAITGLAFGVFRFLFNFYVLSLGDQYNEAFIGTLQTAASFATIAMALPAAYLAERYSQKSIMILTGVISGLSFIGLVLFPFQLTLIAFRMIAGISMSVRQVAMAPFLMANTSEEDRQWVFSFNFGLMTISGFFGNLLGGILPTWLGGWFKAAPTDTLSYQLALGSMMIVTILSIGPLMFIRMPKPDRNRVVELPWVQLWQHGRILSRFLIPQLIIGLGAGLMQPFMNIYFRNVYEKPDPTISIVFAIGGLTMAIAQFVGPVMADKYGKIGTVIMTQGLSVPFLLALGIGAWVAPSNPALAGMWFLIAAGAYIFRLALMNLSNPVYQTFVLEHVPEGTQALTMSLNSLSFQFGWFIMPQVSGWLQVRFAEFGFVPIFFMVAFFYVTAIVVEWWFFQRPLKVTKANVASLS
ncbi:MAG: MFS transporter [Ardenticatenaceae bacterium]|nr:MFS transporter [Anaerolineales bacterium]MCB8921178.1 MFS transporter [Ardenticatenaceae bacterium]MCB8990880.1 MFS transporter [Ardenticatenaceae bacterium]